MKDFVDAPRLLEAMQKALVNCPSCGKEIERGWICETCGRCPKECDCPPSRKSGDLL